MAEEQTIPQRRPEPTTREARAIKRVLDGGGWIPAPSETVRLMIQRLVDAGVKLSRQEAELDAIYWADKGDIRPVRYYAGRWGWNRTKVHELLRELGLKGTGSTPDKLRTSSGQNPDKIRTEKSDSEEDSANLRTRSGQQTDKIRTNSGQYLQTTIPQTSEEPEEKEGDARAREDDPPLDADEPGRSTELDSGRDAPAPGEGAAPPPTPERSPSDESIPEGWTGETIGILRTWTTWQGQSMPAPFQQVIRQLMQPRGSPVGARYGKSTKVHNGYTPAEIERAIEQYSTEGHHSPSSLIGHVIGEIEPRADKGNRRKHGKHDAGSQNGSATANGKHSGDLESFREKTERRIAARRRREGRGDGDVDAPEGDARRLAVGIDHGADQP